MTATQLNIERAVKTFSTLSESQINWKPNPNSWSIGECLSHLINSNRLYLNKFYSILSSVTTSQEIDFPYTQSFPGKMIAKGVNPENVKKTKTFKSFFPDSRDIKKDIIDDYVKASEELISLVNKMKHLDLKKIKLNSPVNKLIRLNLGDPLIVIPKHDERHLNQADRVIRHKEFPNQ